MDEIKLTKLQENKLSTFRDIETVLDRNKTVVDRIPQFGDSVMRFKNVISEIALKAVKKSTVKKGASVTKSLKRIELESVVIEIASGLSVFGAKTENEIVKAIAYVTPTSIDKLRDTEVSNKAVSILNCAVENETELVQYGITSEDINRLRNSITNYNASSSEKSGLNTESIVITGSIKELFTDGMEILDKEIDNFVDSMKTKEKDFYESYYTVRSVKNLGVRHKKQTENPQKTA